MAKSKSFEIIIRLFTLKNAKHHNFVLTYYFAKK